MKTKIIRIALKIVNAKETKYGNSKTKTVRMYAIPVYKDDFIGFLPFSILTNIPKLP
ncbi:MAG: hypothetical protein N3E38_01610 [Candidatus Aenigmarchaeota archaeon]|nr:hypothetical protein [Candidatus Aenigmarchaeota archaeon]